MGKSTQMSQTSQFQSPRGSHQALDYQLTESELKQALYFSNKKKRRIDPDNIYWRPSNMVLWTEYCRIVFEKGPTLRQTR